MILKDVIYGNGEIQWTKEDEEYNLEAQGGNNFWPKFWLFILFMAALIYAYYKF